MVKEYSKDDLRDILDDLIRVLKMIIKYSGMTTEKAERLAGYVSEIAWIIYVKMLFMEEDERIVSEDDPPELF